MNTLSTRGARLKGIPRVLHKRARQALKERDLDEFFGYADSMLSMWLLHRNTEWFRRNGLYEKALLTAWTNQKFMEWRGASMKAMLASCDRKKLLAACDPLPDGETLTVYRGVPPKNEVRGVSWTLDPAVARWFASPTGTVYATDVKKSDIYAYMDASAREGEKEVLLVLAASHPVRVFEAPPVAEREQTQ